MKFETEKELVQFFVDAGIVIDRLTIQVIKDKGYVENSIVDEAEESLENFKKSSFSLSDREGVVKILDSYKDLTNILNDAIQYLKSEVQELKDGKVV